MPLFDYKATNQKGEIVRANVEAINRDEAALALRERGMSPLTITKNLKNPGGILRGKISEPEKAIFCRFLATSLKAGLSLPEAIESVGKEEVNKKMKTVLSDISFQVRRGATLSSVLAKYKKDFGPVFLTMVRAGEESGTLEKSLEYLSKQISDNYELAQNVKGSMIYPAVILVAMMGNGILMLIFVLPRVAGAFLKLDVELPFLTKTLLTFGDFVGQNVFLVIVSLVMLTLVVVGVFMFRQTRIALLALVAKIPAAKKLLNNIDVARFSRTLSTLLKNGVPITEALDVSSDTLVQPKLKRAAKSFKTGVSQGKTLSEMLTEGKQVFPSTLIQSIKAGEKTGSLEKVLGEMASFYESEAGHSLKKLTALLEPILMLIIGVAVGGMVVMMIAPIYGIVGGLQDTIQAN